MTVPTETSSSNPLEQIGYKPSYDDFARCVHCGLCLNHCPTYKLWGLEADSPRGRIRQMMLVNDGKLVIGDVFVHHMDTCLDCRACETACPSGVEYGKLIESARGDIARKYRRPFSFRFVRDIVYRRLLPYPNRIAIAGRLARFYQRSGLQFLARRSGILRVLGLAERERLMPAASPEFFFSRLGQTFPAHGPRRARVAFFAGCIAQVSFAELNDATIRVLQANGCEVVVPKGQLCCGALCVHAGVRDVAQDLARRNIATFLADNCDAIITNAAGCGSTLKEYQHLFTSDSPEHASAENFRAKIRDVTEFLALIGLSSPLGELPMRVTYQDSCHLLHGQKISSAPRELLRRIPGIQLREMALSDQCCGSAGVYNVTETRAALDLLEIKMRSARDTGADVIVTANPGCMLQLRAGSEIHSTGQMVFHVVELLDRSIAAAQPRA
ncbi:MAG TPA: (Fe-S)-binding protein [Candidatus Acidoferrales bacterium]|nr:(Fe-S)-binding protein [Candidatus Acidoferrales bacterium]